MASSCFYLSWQVELPSRVPEVRVRVDRRLKVRAHEVRAQGALVRGQQEKRYRLDLKILMPMLLMFDG